MPFPSLIDINTALQNPQVSFKHRKLLDGEVTDPADPIRDSGRYAAVTQIRIRDKNFALRIPIAEWENSKPRYRMIEREISGRSSVFVECKLLPDAIMVPVPGGTLHDVVVMEWVDGVSLTAFVKDAAERGAVDELGQLRESLQQACNELWDLRVSHGDMSPLNVLVHRSPESNRVNVKFVDYDFVAHPSLGFPTRLPKSPTRHPSRPEVSDTASDRFVFHLYDTVLETLEMRPEIIRRLNDYLDQTLFISLSDATSESNQNLDLLREINPAGVSRLETIAASPYLEIPALTRMIFNSPADAIPSSDWKSLSKKSGKRVSVFGYVRKQEGALIVLEMPTPYNAYRGVVVTPRQGFKQGGTFTGKSLIATGKLRERGGQIMIDDAEVADLDDVTDKEQIPMGWMRKHIEAARKTMSTKVRRRPPAIASTTQAETRSAYVSTTAMHDAQATSTRFPPFDGTALQRRSFGEPPPMGIDISENYKATIRTSLGNIEISLDTAAAPRTVNNFIFLALHHFYDGLIFHRVVKNNAIYTGDPTGVGVGGPGYSFDDGRATGQPYEIGSVAMASTGRNTLGSQFFIVTGPDGCGIPAVYAMFGRVTRGLRTIEKIQNVPTNRVLDARTFRPIKDVVIESVTISVGR